MKSIIRSMLFRLWKLIPQYIKDYPFCLYWQFRVPKADHAHGSESGRIFLVGFFSAPTGLGESVRRYYDELQQTGAEITAVDMTAFFLQPSLDGIFTNPCVTPQGLPDDTGPGTIVLHINPPAYLFALEALSPILPGKHRVGYWAWELLSLPKSWKFCIAFVDSIEVPSSFTAASFEALGKPVRVHPHVHRPVKKHNRAFAEDGVVRVFFILDLRSGFDRKNPLAAIEAFKKIFANTDKARFLLKVSSAAACPRDAAALRSAVSGVANIDLYETFLDEDALSELYAKSDIYLSLHRSEGYGLTIKEAIERGMYVVTTGWSGNMDFFPANKAYAVPYRLPSPGGRFLLTPRPMWAQADTDAAACMLQEIVRKERPDIAGLLPAPPQYRLLETDSAALVIVTYRDVTDTLRCLESVYAMNGRPSKILVVENGSPPSVAEEFFSGWKVLAARKREEPPVAVCEGEAIPPSQNIMIRIEQNSGYARGCNVGLKVAVSDPAVQAIWMLNNDVIVRPDTLDTLCNRLNMRPDANMAVSLQASMEDRGTLLSAGGGSFSRITGVTRDIGRKLLLERAMAWPAEMFESQMDYACGASALLRRNALEAVGFLEERYFLYYEDVEYSLRSRRNGFLFAVANDSVVYHKMGATASNDPDIDCYAVRNRLDCVKQYRLWALPFALLHVFCGIGKSLLQGNRSGAAARLKGIHAFCRGRWGDCRGN